MCVGIHCIVEWVNVLFHLFTEKATNSVLLSASSINDLLTACEEEEFQPTLEVITNAMNDHHLGGFIKSHDCLTIHKTLGEGEMLYWFNNNLQCIQNKL